MAGPLTEEQVKVEPVKVERANRSREKAAFALAVAGFLIVEFNLLDCAQERKQHFEPMDSDFPAYLCLPRQ